MTMLKLKNKNSFPIKTDRALFYNDAIITQNFYVKFLSFRWATPNFQINITIT